MIERMIGAARLDPSAYETVEADQEATTQALLIVILVGISTGIGTLTQGIGGLIFGIIAGVIGWVVYSTVAYWVGTTIFPGPETRATVGQVLRTLGFAYTPQLLNFLRVIPVLGPLIALIVLIWSLVAAVIALRQALDFTTGRAIATAIVAAVIVVVIYTVVAALLFGAGML